MGIRFTKLFSDAKQKNIRKVGFFFLLQCFVHSKIIIQLSAMTASDDNIITCKNVEEVNLLMRRRSVEARLGHVCHVRVAAVTEVVEEVFRVAFWVTDTIPLFVFRTTAAVSEHAVSCVVPRQGMVAF